MDTHPDSESKPQAEKPSTERAQLNEPLSDIEPTDAPPFDPIPYDPVLGNAPHGRHVAPREKPVGRIGWLAIVGAAVAFGFGLGLVFASLFGLGQDTLFDDGVVSEVFDKVSPAVVEIEIAGIRRIGSLEIRGIPSWGSGFLIDELGHIVTNYHVVAGGEEFTIRLSDGRELSAERLGVSQADDLAVLKVDPTQVGDITPLKLADSSDVTPGQLAIAIGSPFREFNSIVVGVVSGIGRDQRSVLNRPIPDMIQTDAPLNQGNSGGPLLNAAGEVIGINSSVRVSSGDSRLEDFRMGFAVPSNTALSVLPSLIAAIDMRRPWIGIQGTPTPREMVEQQGYPRGIYITGVFADSPARRAGLTAFRRFGAGAQGDVITAVDGRPVESVDDMVGYLNTKSPGDSVTLSVFSQGEERSVEVTLDPWPDGA